jgi:hypothetical protein
VDTGVGVATGVGVTMSPPSSPVASTGGAISPSRGSSSSIPATHSAANKNSLITTVRGGFCSGKGSIILFM